MGSGYGGLWGSRNTHGLVLSGVGSIKRLHTAGAAIAALLVYADGWVSCRGAPMCPTSARLHSKAVGHRSRAVCDCCLCVVVASYRTCVIVQVSFTRCLPQPFTRRPPPRPRCVIVGLAYRCVIGVAGPSWYW
jgi:hypothetical protein